MNIFSIGQNEIDKKDLDTIQMSVIFNNNYNKIKKSNEIYIGF